MINNGLFILASRHICVKWDQHMTRRINLVVLILTTTKVVEMVISLAHVKPYASTMCFEQTKGRKSDFLINHKINKWDNKFIQ